jgi:hypothetical protein
MFPFAIKSVASNFIYSIISNMYNIYILFTVFLKVSGDTVAAITAAFNASL